MPSLRALLIAAQPESDAGIDWSDLLAGTDIHLSVTSSPSRAVAMLRENGEPEHHLVVLGPDLADPAEVAGRLRRTLAERPLVILTHGSSDELRHSLSSPARLLGVRWTVIDLDSERAEQRLCETLAAVRDRRRLRTTLGRINTTLSSQASAKLSPLHRYTASQRFLGNIVRHGRDAIVATSPDGTIVAWNLAAETLFGLDREEAVGRHVAEIGDEAWTAMASSLPFDIARSGGAERTNELIDIGMDGRDLEVTVSVIEGGASVAAGLALAVRDVTERKGLERQLAESRRLESLGLLAGGIAHVINNALTTVQGNAEYLLMTDTDEEERAEGLRDIRRSVEKATDLCGQMIALGGREAYAPARADLNELVRGHQSALRTSLPPGADLKLELADALPSAHVDERQVQRMLENLVENSAEALADGTGTVIVRTRAGVWGREDRGHPERPDERAEVPFVEISVRDDGAGMDANIRRRALEPFVSTKFMGRGLGLPVVLGLARSHGGTVGIDSTPGEGTEVRVRFPVRAHAE